MDKYPLYYLQSRRTHLLYKKANWLTTELEDAELDQLNKELNTLHADRTPEQLEP